jgi:hypothetical protein
VKLSDDVIEQAFTRSATVVERYFTPSAILWAFCLIESPIAVPEMQSTIHPPAHMKRFPVFRCASTFRFQWKVSNAID